MKDKKYEVPLVIVTGAAGMIGSCVVRRLNDLGNTHLILVDDLDTTDKWKNLLGKKFIDIIPSSQLFPFLEGREKEIKAFIHLGACSDTLEKNGAFLMDNNYRYTVRLAEYALTHHIRFIYASSAATYGDGKKGFSDDHSLLQELRPLNLYGFSKHLFDLWAQREGVLDRVVGLKYFNVFGPNENHKAHMASMVYKMCPVVQDKGVLRLFQSSEPLLFKDGESSRDFIYVKDAVQLTCDFLENDLGGIFNIGSGVPTTWNALAKAVFHALDKPVQIEYIPMPEDLKKQYQNYTCADMTKLIQARKQLKLGSCCQFSVEEGVCDYIQNYLLKDVRW
ncbi:MAG: ADP-glyceromanno-heptose 6-epimerase [Verrucomicrobia bacterium]|nr:ADP-glyceromanno-heptose 6-epimerase [Verrucomicrobiota bacterium]